MIKKYRAWISDEQKMIYATRIEIFDTVCYVYDAIENYTYQIEPGELMQFAGVQSEDGDDIYESDILEEHSYGGTSRGMVEWWEHGFYFDDVTHTNFNGDRCKILGNIFESPDALSV